MNTIWSQSIGFKTTFRVGPQLRGSKGVKMLLKHRPPSVDSYVSGASKPRIQNINTTNSVRSIKGLLQWRIIVQTQPFAKPMYWIHHHDYSSDHHHSTKAERSVINQLIPLNGIIKSKTSTLRSSRKNFAGCQWMAAAGAIMFGSTQRNVS